MERMRAYLDNGMLELDNNTAERGMRAIALAKTIWDPTFSCGCRPRLQGNTEP